MQCAYSFFEIYKTGILRAVSVQVTFVIAEMPLKE
jgi:hypothetical protein